MPRAKKTRSDCDDFHLDAIVLLTGSHSNDDGTYDGECCLVEASNRVAACVPEYRDRFGAADTFSDDHRSIRRVVRALALGLNDMPWDSDQARTDALKPYVTKILGTRTTDADEETCAWMANRLAGPRAHAGVAATRGPHGGGPSTRGAGAHRRPGDV